MKRLYRYALPALSAALLAGCTDLDTAPFGSTVTSDQKEDVLAKDPSKISASVTAITANFTQYAATFGESENVHSDIGYPSIMLATDTRGTDMISDYISSMSVDGLDPDYVSELRKTLKRLQ